MAIWGFLLSVFGAFLLGIFTGESNVIRQMREGIGRSEEAGKFWIVVGAITAFAGIALTLTK